MANDEMKRVGLVFDANGVADFKTSLKTVNASINENRAQFKELKSTWDESTKASEKLKSTQEYLSKQYEDSSKKVNVLSTELEELENAENRNEVAISKKKASLATATTTMNHYKNGLDEVNQKLKSGTADIEQYAKQIENFGKKSKEIGSSLTKNVTAPLIAVGAGALAAWNEIDSAYDNIVAGTGATGEALYNLQDVFDEVYGSMPVAASEASDAVADLNTRFGFTDDALYDASKQFLKFAEVNKTDVSSAIQLVSRAMGDASIDSSEYSSVLDALTAASQASGISIDKLTENITKYGAPMRALGFDTQESIAIFAQWEKAGVNTEIAFSGMKKAISSWSAEGKDARVEFQKTLKEIESCPDIATATTKAIEVFGTKAGPDLADAIQGGRFSVEEMMKVVEESGGIVSQSFSDMQDPADQAKIAMNNLTLAGAELGDTIQVALGPILENISKLLNGLTKWLSGLDSNTKMIVVTIGALLASLGPLLIIIGAIAGSISKIMLLYTSFATASVGATGATVALSTSLASLLIPIAAIVAVIAAVVIAVNELWNTNEVFRTSIEEAITSIQELFQSLWETILAPIFEAIKVMLMDVWDNGIKPLWDNWVLFISGIILNMNELWLAIQPILMWFIETFGPSLVDIFEFVSSMFGNSVNTILNIAGILLKSISEIVDSVIKVFKGIIDFIVGIFTGDWDRAWKGISSVFGGIFDGLVAIAKAPLNLIIGLINGMIGGVEAGVNFLIDCLNKLSFDVPDWIPVIGGEHWGFDFGSVSLGRIKELAKGGTLQSGMSIVAEAGPELLTQMGNKTTVTPLTNGGGAIKNDLIDYEKMTVSFVKALKSLYIYMDESVVGKVVDDRLLEVL